MFVSQKVSKVIVLACFVFITSCSHNASTSEMAVEETLTAEENMVGVISKNDLLSHEALFKKGYESFIVSEEDKLKISDWPSNLYIDIYFGTWCHDSEREVPKLLSILDNNLDVNFKLIALDLNKDDPQKLALRNSINYTPTFVVFLGDKEIGRIIERPNQSLVDDITKIYVNSLKIND